MSLLALQDLFKRRREGATGVWKLGAEPSRTVFFDSGDIVFAQSTYPTDRLTHLMVERGKLTQAQLDYAMANLKPGFSIGKNLIEMGFITQRDLLDVARAQVDRVVQLSMSTVDLEPVFEARELDARVVRLPMDSPQLLLNSILNIQDRERLLELLGPLNQVVVLQSRRLMEMNLPADLAKLPPLLDGTHTLLELSRESLAEPVRLGAFALFLREIGWARLHEMPPLDRQALDRALAPDTEPLSPPLPGASMKASPSLFSTIEAASSPTSNLEHLSSSLDADTAAEAVPPPVARRPEPALEVQPKPPVMGESGFTAEAGQAFLPSPPQVQEAPFSESKPLLSAEPEPGVILKPFTLGAEPALELRAPVSDEQESDSPRWGLYLLIGLALLGGLAGGWWWWMNKNRHEHPSTPNVPGASALPANTSSAVGAVPPVTDPPKPVVIGTSIPERLEAIRKGDLVLAAKQGEKLLQETKDKQWALRLEIACEAESLKKILDAFPDGMPDLFITPITLKDGRNCYQIFYGTYLTRRESMKVSKGLPATFLAGGDRPKPFKLTQIPTQQ